MKSIARYLPAFVLPKATTLLLADGPKLSIGSPADFCVYSAAFAHITYLIYNLNRNLNRVTLFLNRHRQYCISQPTVTVVPQRFDDIYDI